MDLEYLKKRAEQYARLYPEDAAFALAHPEAIGIIPDMRASYAMHDGSVWGFTTEQAYQHIFVEKCLTCRHTTLFQNPIAHAVLGSVELRVAQAAAKSAIPE